MGVGMMRARSFYLAAGAASLALAIYAVLLAPASTPTALAQTPPTPTPVRSSPNGPRPAAGPSTTVNVNIALPANAPGGSPPAAGQPAGSAPAPVAGGAPQPAPVILFPGQDRPIVAPPIRTVVDPCAGWGSRQPPALAGLAAGSCPAGPSALSGRYPNRFPRFPLAR
jgi:hypothetical protein